MLLHKLAVTALLSRFRTLTAAEFTSPRTETRVLHNTTCTIGQSALHACHQRVLSSFAFGALLTIAGAAHKIGIAAAKKSLVAVHCLPIFPDAGEHWATRSIEQAWRNAQRVSGPGPAFGADVKAVGCT